MRRLLLTSAALLALALSAGAAFGASDGTLVIKGADNGDGVTEGARSVVTLVVTGFVIGRVTDQGRIRIYDLDPTDQGAPDVTGAGTGTPVKFTPSTGPAVTGTEWYGSNFRFRAVNGTFRVVIWGSGVYVFASGQGKVWMTGNPANRNNDGTYSLDGSDFVSLPLATPLTSPYLLNG
jgi:hypothetical protein